MIGQKLSGYQFATCCYCLLNSRTLELTYARAGHPYPLLIRQGRLPEQLEVRGSLLGIFEGAEFVQQTVQLQKGDKLLIYSDGAEPYIGRFQDKDGFKFREQFRQIIDFSIDERLVCNRLKTSLAPGFLSIYNAVSTDLSLRKEHAYLILEEKPDWKL
ncbi:MAG: serine/threonine-protein phosphatase [Chloroflexi bacterium]|nr:serine/threonine-protein phosphatase [Chloroflexota bacterium]